MSLLTLLTSDKIWMVCVVYGHLVSARTFGVIPKLFLNLQITRSDMRPHIKLAVSLLILHIVTLIFLKGLSGYVWVNTLTFITHVTSLTESLRVKLMLRSILCKMSRFYSLLGAYKDTNG